MTGFFHELEIPQWDLQLRVMICRKHVAHESPKNFQLDLFTPDDGHFEYAAVATNLALDLPALYAFICSRGAQEKTIAELKGAFALDVVPTRHYGANSAWQQLSVLAHNLIRSFQLDTLAAPKPRSRKRTYTYLIRSMRTLRFLLTRAGRLTRIGGRHVLRLAHNPATQGPLWVDQSPFGRLSYFRIGANRTGSATQRPLLAAQLMPRDSSSCRLARIVLRRLQTILGRFRLNTPTREPIYILAVSSGTRESSPYASPECPTGYKAGCTSMYALPRAPQPVGIDDGAHRRGYARCRSIDRAPRPLMGPADTTPGWGS